MNDIISLAKELGDLREKVKVSEEYLAGLKADKQKCQNKLMEAMKSSDLKSIKTSDANYALTVKKDIKIFDEQAAMLQLQERGIYEEYVKPKLDTLKFKSYANSLLKETGEVIDGTEMTETSYISIKSLKE